MCDRLTWSAVSLSFIQSNFEIWCAENSPKQPKTKTKNPKHKTTPTKPQCCVFLVFKNHLSCWWAAGSLCSSEAAQAEQVQGAGFVFSFLVCFSSSGWFRPLMLGEEVSNSTWRGIYPPRAGAGWGQEMNCGGEGSQGYEQEQLLPGSSSGGFSLGADSCFIQCRSREAGRGSCHARIQGFSVPSSRGHVPAVHENWCLGECYRWKGCCVFITVVSLLHQSETASRC